jgi:cell wall-associated NlpC family hydrolase
VAIYAGNDQMVEAPDSAHSVRVVPVRWSATYLGARRYLDS